jgi:hypothetical protein
MSDRIQLETEISRILATIDDLRLVAKNPDPDLIIGIANLLDRKYEAIFDCFCKTFKLDDHGEDMSML